jgi:glycerophosphoryl diester phosphodiesterase
MTNGARGGIEQPKPQRIERGTFLRPFAHRGLHNSAKGLIENTAPAFIAAIEKDYGIECDLQAAGGGAPMVFHDAMLDRLVEATGPIAYRSPAELAQLRYRGQDTRILSFHAFLELVKGRTPLLVEVKRNSTIPEKFLESIAQQAQTYEGAIALMSFDWDVMGALARLAPDIPRGVIIGSHQVRRRSQTGRASTSDEDALAALLEAAPRDVDFYAVEVKLLEAASAWMARHRPELLLLTWTVRTPAERAIAARFADAPIFEGYEP